jgi:hypothetical protein
MDGTLAGLGRLRLRARPPSNVLSNATIPSIPTILASIILVSPRIDPDYYRQASAPDRQECRRTLRYSRRMSAAAIFRYLGIPLRMAPLLLIGTFSVLLIVAAKAGLFGIPLGLIILSWFTKYSFVLMDHLAEGVVEPPVLSIEMVNPLSEQRPMIMAAADHRPLLCVGRRELLGRQAGRARC